MSRMIGTVSRGVRAPIIRNGDDIVEIVTASVLEAQKDAGLEFHDKDKQKFMAQAQTMFMCQVGLVPAEMAT